MSTIEVTNLNKSCGDVTALDDASLTIPDGEFVVVLGRSGAGKSTLLRCLNGIAHPTSGSITIDDTSVTGPRSDVAMVFQQHYILGQVSAYNNALTGALGRTSLLGSLLGLYDGDGKQKMLRALETVGLLDETSQRAERMSGGQQQCVDIARALIQNPNLLLVGGPAAGLDPVSVETVMQYIRDTAGERDLTTIAGLHQVNITRKFGERFIRMKDGQIAFDGYREDFDTDVIGRIYGDIEMKAIREEQTDESPENNVAVTGGARLHGC